MKRAAPVMMSVQMALFEEPTPLPARPPVFAVLAVMPASLRCVIGYSLAWTEKCVIGYSLLAPEKRPGSYPALLEGSFFWKEHSPSKSASVSAQGSLT